jgi:hypothetical protein
MKKIFSHVFLSTKTFSHLVISMVTKMRVGTKNVVYDNTTKNGH